VVVDLGVVVDLEVGVVDMVVTKVMVVVMEKAIKSMWKHSLRTDNDRHKPTTWTITLINPNMIFLSLVNKLQLNNIFYFVFTFSLKCRVILKIKWRCRGVKQSWFY
jgi:hypothetical protein